MKVQAGLGPHQTQIMHGCGPVQCLAGGCLLLAPRATFCEPAVHSQACPHKAGKSSHTERALSGHLVSQASPA